MDVRWSGGYHKSLFTLGREHVQVLTEQRHHANTATCLLWPALLGNSSQAWPCTAAAQPSVAICLWRSPAFNCGNGCSGSYAPDWRQVGLNQGHELGCQGVHSLRRVALQALKGNQGSLGQRRVLQAKAQRQLQRPQQLLQAHKLQLCRRHKVYINNVT